MKILIVEDEIAIAELIKISLENVGYLCYYASNGKIAADLLEVNRYDLILLDIMLPKVNGYELMEYIKPMNIPVIFITAKGSVQDKVKGLYMGGDDYIVKPFAIDELLARIDCVLRRYHKDIRHIAIQDIEVDMALRKVFQNHQEISLTKKEYELLLYLIQNKNIVLYRETIYQQIWQEEHFQTRTLDLHIQRLRKKLQWHSYIKTVYKIGYVLEVKDEVF